MLFLVLRRRGLNPPVVIRILLGYITDFREPPPWSNNALLSGSSLACSDMIVCSLILTFYFADQRPSAIPVAHRPFSLIVTSANHSRSDFRYDHLWARGVHSSAISVGIKWHRDPPQAIRSFPICWRQSCRAESISIKKNW